MPRSPWPRKWRSTYGGASAAAMRGGSTCRGDAAGGLNFLEVNPLARLYPERNPDVVILGRLTGVPYVELIGRIVASASGRAAAWRHG